jgi:biopolymer transport protein ExbD
MPSFRSIRSRRSRRKKVNKAFELQLTSMMDVLVIILVFLLKSYSTSQNSFATVAGMKMPYSASPDVPRDSLQVIITPEGMTFEGERIVDFVQKAEADSTEASYQLNPTEVDEGGMRVIPLFNALTKAKEKAELLRAKSNARDEQGNPLPFEGILAIQADKRVKYDMLRKIMYTAGAAGYKTFRFLAQAKEI